MEVTPDSTICGVRLTQCMWCEQEVPFRESVSVTLGTVWTFTYCRTCRCVLMKTTELERKQRSGTACWNCGVERHDGLPGRGPRRSLWRCQYGCEERKKYCAGCVKPEVHGCDPLIQIDASNMICPLEQAHLDVTEYRLKSFQAEVCAHCGKWDHHARHHES